LGYLHWKRIPRIRAVIDKRRGEVGGWIREAIKGVDFRRNDVNLAIAPVRFLQNWYIDLRIETAVPGVV
jgi:hypothetical protein